MSGYYVEILVYYLHIPIIGFENEIWLDFILFECIVMLYDGYMMVILDDYSV